jgi:UDP-glucose 6-dehydrogenase
VDKARFANKLKWLPIALSRLAFKANNNDILEATSLVVIKDLLATGATVTAYIPVAT